MAQVTEMNKQEVKLLNRKIKKAEKYLKACKGAFRGMVEGDMEVRQGGVTFAISSDFHFLNLNQIYVRSSYIPSEVYNKDEDFETNFSSFLTWYESVRYKGKTTLYLPTYKSIWASKMTLKGMVGGGLHEFGHKLLDSREVVSHDLKFKERLKELYKFMYDNKLIHDIHVINRLTLSDDEKETLISLYRRLRKSIKRWSNVFADIRLERVMKKMNPIAGDRFASTQEWVWGLEEQGRINAPQRMLLAVVRDLGKDHDSESKEKVFGQYHEGLLDIAKEIFKIDSVEELMNSSYENREDEAHLPFLCALKTIMFLEDRDEDNEEEEEEEQDEGEDEEEEGNCDGEGDTNGDDTDNEGDGDGTGGEGGEGEGDSQGESEEDSDEEGEDGSGGSDGEDEGEGEEGSGGGEGEGDEEGEGEGGQGEGSDGSEGEEGSEGSDSNTGEGSEGSTGEGKEEKEGEGSKKEKPKNRWGRNGLKNVDDIEALDPSSALEKEVGDSEEVQGYIDNGAMTEYRSLKDLKRIHGIG